VAIRVGGKYTKNIRKFIILWRENDGVTAHEVAFVWRTGIMGNIDDGKKVGGWAKKIAELFLKNIDKTFCGVSSRFE